jgi:hypothetical protein
LSVSRKGADMRFVAVAILQLPLFLNSTLTTDHASARAQHHAQDAVDAEPGVPEAGASVSVIASPSARAGPRCRGGK